MATTFRQVLNRVLRTIGEDEIDDAETELTDEYHKLVATFVNQIKEEIEDAHNWRDLQQTHTATVSASSNLGPITGANERSRLSRAEAEQGHVPLVFDVTTSTAPIPLTERPVAEIDYRIATDIPGTATEPSMFAVVGDSDGTLSLRVYPKPTVDRTITVIMFTPQDYLEEDDLDTVIRVPARPLILGAIWYALEERGEEMGTNSMFTEERWRKALDDAIARDSAEQGDYDLIPV